MANERILWVVTVVNIGQAKTDLSRLIAQVEQGDDVEIARDGVPVARLVPITQTKPGRRFLDTYGRLAGQIRIPDDFDYSDAELDEMGL